MPKQRPDRLSALIQCFRVVARAYLRGVDSGARRNLSLINCLTHGVQSNTVTI